MKDEYFEKFCDELILMSEHDKELKDGLQWLEKQFSDDGKNSIYDIIWKHIIMRHDDSEERLSSFMKNLTRYGVKK